MRTLTLTMATLVTALGVAFSAGAATLSVASDQSSYLPSDTITLTVTGDSQGATANGIFGRLVFSGSGSATITGFTQGVLTSFNGFITWAQSPINQGANFIDLIDYVAGLTALPTDQLLVSTVVLHANGTGTVNVAWETTATGFQLGFFGLTNAPGTAFAVNVIPEPTTASLLGLGLVGLTVAGRRRKS